MGPAPDHHFTEKNGIKFIIAILTAQNQYDFSPLIYPGRIDILFLIVIYSFLDRTLLVIERDLRKSMDR